MSWSVVAITIVAIYALYRYGVYMDGKKQAE
jgi:hypothetical protein